MLLLTVTVADPKLFTHKYELVTYIRVFIKLYNKKNLEQVYEISRMIELKKIRTLITGNPRNLDTHQMIEILLILYSTFVVPRNDRKIENKSYICEMPKN